MSVGQAQALIGAREFLEWLAYFSLEAEDLRQSHETPAQRPDATARTPEAMKNLLRTLTKVVNG